MQTAFFAFFQRIREPGVSAAGQAAVCAPISGGPTRRKRCKDRSLRSQSRADFLISIAVAQNGCCLEQFSLPGRHCRPLSFLSLCSAFTLTARVLSRRPPPSLSLCLSLCGSTAVLQPSLLAFTTPHSWRRYSCDLCLHLVMAFSFASPEYSHPKPSGGEPPIRALASSYEFSPDPTHRAHSTASFNCGHHCSQ